jgi:predicted transcriptional regulator
MATNLRLRPETEAALRAEAERTGRSQQQLIREALDEYLKLRPTALASRSMDELIAAGVVRPAKVPFRRAHRLLELPDGVTSLDLLDRENRL